jgi:hypothetical protein
MGDPCMTAEEIGKAGVNFFAVASKVIPVVYEIHGDDLIK